MKYLIASLLVFYSIGVFGQHTVEECQRLAQRNYPLIKQLALVERSLQYNLSNASKGYLPQGAFSVQGSYQSDVTSIELPFLAVDGIHKDQYQARLEISQVIWDGGLIKEQKNMVRDEANVDSAKIHASLYTINERVNSLYFGILMLDEQLKLVDLLDEELKRNHKQVQSYVSAGVATRADLDAVEVEILSNRQKRDEVVPLRKAYQTMLSLLVGEQVEQVMMPAVEEVDATHNNHPELALLRSQIQQTERQTGLLSARNLPKFGAFAQLGYGNVGLNMLESGFTPYGIAGLKMSWNFGTLYTKRNDKAKIVNQKLQLENQMDVFLFNTKLTVTQLEAEIQKLNRQMELDDRIIELRSNIKRAAESKVAGGTMNVNDMLREVTAENSARLQKILHKVQLVMNIYNIKYKINQ